MARNKNDMATALNNLLGTNVHWEKLSASDLDEITSRFLDYENMAGVFCGKCDNADDLIKVLSSRVKDPMKLAVEFGRMEIGSRFRRRVDQFVDMVGENRPLKNVVDLRLAELLGRVGKQE